LALLFNITITFSHIYRPRWDHTYLAVLSIDLILGGWVCVCAHVGARACACTNGHILINYIFSVGAQTAGLIETQICTNTHRGNWHKLWESVAPPRASAKRESEREVREYMNGTSRSSRRERKA
jgi:hypothetical protein